MKKHCYGNDYFAVAPKTISRDQVITAIESSIRTLPKVDAKQVRFVPSEILLSAKAARSDITND